MDGFNPTGGNFGEFDPCDAIVTRQLSFDLRTIAHLYELMYGDLDPIRLNLYRFFDSLPGEKLSVVYYPDGTEPPSMLPMAIGNYWVYAETTWTDQGIHAEIDSIEVIGKFRDSLGDWWKLSGSLPWLPDSIMVRGDRPPFGTLLLLSLIHISEPTRPY